jgi:flagellar motor component MotA
MLFISLIVGSILIIIGGAIDRKNKYSSDGATFGAFGIIIDIASIIALFIVSYNYNIIKTTTDSRLKVLTEQNELVLTQIEPLVQQALNYESNTYKELKLTPENIVAFGNMYPQLQANSFIQSQIDIIINNQNEIKNLKLQKASLNAYHLWLFTKKE